MEEKFLTVLSSIATKLFKDEQPKNNYIENTVSVHNCGSILRIEILCVNEYGGSYAVYSGSKEASIEDIPEELRYQLPRTGDWLYYPY